MNTDTPTPEKPKAAAKPVAKPAAAAEDITVKVRVLVNKLHVAGGVAAKGAVLKLKQNTASYHESRNEVQVLGTA